MERSQRRLCSTMDCKCTDSNSDMADLCGELSDFQGDLANKMLVKYYLGKFEKRMKIKGNVENVLEIWRMFWKSEIPHHITIS